MNTSFISEAVQIDTGVTVILGLVIAAVVAFSRVRISKRRIGRHLKFVAVMLNE